jgi:hypothetical protein
VVEPLRAPAGYVAAVAALRGPVSIRCDGTACVQSDRARDMRLEHAHMNFWAYPEGVSWAGSRLSLPRTTRAFSKEIEPRVRSFGARCEKTCSVRRQVPRR